MVELCITRYFGLVFVVLTHAYIINQSNLFANYHLFCKFTFYSYISSSGQLFWTKNLQIIFQILIANLVVLT